MTFLLAPGAGTSCTHPSLVRWADRLARHGAVQSFDYPYRLAGRSRPDPLNVLVDAHREAFETALDRHGGPVVCVGRSMGGRIGCHLAVEGAPVAALVCLGYPLFGQGDPNKRRDAVLIALRTPVLFVQGTRDALCPLSELEQVRARMTARSSVHVVQGGDHSLVPTKTALRGTTAEAVDVAVEQAILAFVAG